MLIGIEDVPHLVLAQTAVTLACHLIIGVHLDGQVAMGINELDEQRETVSIAAIDIVSHEFDAMMAHELSECHAGLHSLGHHRLTTGHCRQFPRLANELITCWQSFEFQQLAAAPKDGP